MTKTQFNKMLKESIKVKAFQYLMRKQRSKGQEINYMELKMAEYLMPNYENLSIDDKRKIFEIRNRMLPIPANFPFGIEEKRCRCGEIENTKHIYICKYWSEENEKTSFEMIYTDDVLQLKKVYVQYELNYKIREKYQNEQEKIKNEATHVINLTDPMFYNVE